jgi:hypothetical protein
MIVLISIFVVGFVAIYGCFDMMKQIKNMVDEVGM